MVIAIFGFILSVTTNALYSSFLSRLTTFQQILLVIILGRPELLTGRFKLCRTTLAEASEYFLCNLTLFFRVVIDSMPVLGSHIIAYLINQIGGVAKLIHRKFTQTLEGHFLWIEYNLNALCVSSRTCAHLLVISVGTKME